MVMTLDNLKDEIRGVLINENVLQNNNINITAYSVKGKVVRLTINSSPTTNAKRFFVNASDYYTLENSESQIMFNEFPKKSVEYSPFVGSNSNLIIKNNSGVRKAVENILKAVGSVYGLPVQKIFIQ